MRYSEDAERVEAAIVGVRPTSTGWVHAACIFCGEEKPDKKKSLHVNLATGRYRCHRCSEWGRIRVVDGLGAAPARLPEKPDPNPVLGPPAGWEPLYGEGRGGFSIEPARAYVRKRGIAEAAARALRIGAVPLGTRGCACCPDRPRCRWGGRVIVPHFDEAGVWRGWVGRVWISKPREGVLPYLYPPHMKRTLYNARVLAEKTDEPALVVEGALDAAYFHMQAVALFGSPTEAHVEEIKRRARRPIAVVLDGDVPAKSEMLALRLRFDGLCAGWVRLAPRQDPDEVPRDWLLEEARRCVR